MLNSICFVGSDVYPVLNPILPDAYIGGESVQQSLLMKAFLQEGFEVSLVDKDYGQPATEIIAGIRVLKTFDLTSGFPVLRFFHPRLTSLWHALKAANADVYYQSCAGMQTGVVAWFCRKHERKFVYRTAHDTDCIPGQQLIRFRRDKKIFEYGLKHADIIAVQGLKQQELLRRHYKLKSFPINMAVEIPDDKENTGIKDIDVLWVNNFRPFKRPDLAIEAARKLFPYRVTMVGGPCLGQESYYDTIRQTAEAVGNLTLTGPVPYFRVNDFFARSKVFINTSDVEGFPNSFLQAWARGVPVVSFFDPDDLISRKGIGVAAQSLDHMILAVRALIEDENRRNQIGALASDFAVNSFSPQQVARQYINLLTSQCYPKSQ